jgi:hypothetical protein
MNTTQRLLRNVMVANALPEGVEFLEASDRGLYQAPSRTVYWLIDQLAPGQMQPLGVRVQGGRTGQYPNPATARAEGVAEVQGSGLLAVEGFADLSMRVIDRKNPVELGRENVYEVRLKNAGSLPATNVRLQIQFPPGFTPKRAQGPSRHAIDRQSVVFEPVPTLGEGGEAVFRISAVPSVAGNDHPVRFMATSDQVRTPITSVQRVIVSPN